MSRKFQKHEKSGKVKLALIGVALVLFATAVIGLLMHFFVENKENIPIRILSGQLAYDPALTDSTDFTGATLSFGDIPAVVEKDGRWTAKVPYGEYNVIATHPIYAAKPIEKFEVGETTKTPDITFMLYKVKGYGLNSDPYDWENKSYNQLGASYGSGSARVSFTGIKVSPQEEFVFRSELLYSENTGNTEGNWKYGLVLHDDRAFLSNDFSIGLFLANDYSGERNGRFVGYGGVDQSPLVSYYTQGDPFGAVPVLPKVFGEKTITLTYVRKSVDGALKWYMIAEWDSTGDGQNDMRFVREPKTALADVLAELDDKDIYLDLSFGVDVSSGITKCGNVYFATDTEAVNKIDQNEEAKINLQSKSKILYAAKSNYSVPISFELPLVKANNNKTVGKLLFTGEDIEDHGTGERRYEIYCDVTQYIAQGYDFSDNISMGEDVEIVFDEGHSRLAVCSNLSIPFKETDFFKSLSTMCIYATNDRIEVPFPDIPIKEGYTFAGWYYGTQAEHGTDCKIYDSEVLYAETNLHAHWEINTFQVTYKSNGGLINGSSNDVIETVNWNTVISLISPTKTGYEFKGWFLSDGTEYTNQPVTEDITLTAHWEVRKFTVTFYVDGEVYETKLVSFGSALVDVVNESNLKILSVRMASGAPTFDENGAVIVTEDCTVEAQEMSNTDKVINTVKENKWAIIGGVAGGVALIMIIAAVCGGAKRKRRR